MECIPSTRRVLLGDQLVEVWEDPSVPFGWSVEHLCDYLEQADWLFLFNAVMLTTPWELPRQGS